MRCSAALSSSTRTPLRPTSTPGRAVCTITLTASPVRSISTRGMPADLYSFAMYARIL
jgi:hypothetical protein